MEIDNEHEGFDVERGKTWIYPTNYPCRDYQYNIIQKALFNNTLVSLPTGLGKTFIAAVVMYNFFNWYPRGKVIFLAPTKPLVQQQIDACYNIMAIPVESTVVLTGTKTSLSRVNLWNEKRVFYVTPQVLQNDLNKLTELGATIKCVVFDEAHKARGNYAYCNVIKKLLEQGHTKFRILALTATPGTNIINIAEVIRNLLISRLEFRTEESIDVRSYAFRRSIETIVVPLSSKLQEIKTEYLQVLEHYTKTLKKFNIIQGCSSNVTKGKIFMIMKNFQSQQRDTRSPHYSQIMTCLNISVTLYHAFDLLIRHGLRSFVTFFNEHMEKPLLRCDTNLKRLIDKVKQYLGAFTNITIMPDGSYPNVPKDIVFGHPKFYKLKEVLCKHFEKAKDQTKVMVFFEYRESVTEAHILLLQCSPLIKPRAFIGQNSGVTQKIQMSVIHAFRNGECNTLLSTCIGEEGLDVGEVDLIVCFDISNKSPIRMVQRMGRTGRKRDGKVLMLVTQGREEQTLKECLYKSNKLSSLVSESNELKKELYKNNPRMVPDNILPVCEKKFIQVKPIEKKGTLRNFLTGGSSISNFLRDVEVTTIQERIPKINMLFNQTNFNTSKDHQFQYHIEQQRTVQNTFIIGHSKDSKLFTNLMNFADYTRFNIQHAYSDYYKTKNLKQSTLKDMFLNREIQSDFQNTQDLLNALPKLNSEISIPETSILKKDFTKLNDYLLNHSLNYQKHCKHCKPTLTSFNCEKFKISSITNTITKDLNINIPSDSILHTIEIGTLKSIAKSFSSINDSLEIELFDEDCESILDQVDWMQLDLEAQQADGNNLEEIDANVEICENDNQVENKVDFDLEHVEIKVQEAEDMCETELLEFFKLSSLKDIFCNSIEPKLKRISENTEDEATSPIISSGEYRRQLKRRKLQQPTDNFHTTENDLTYANSCPTKTNHDTYFDDFCDLSYYGHSIRKNIDVEVSLNSFSKNCTFQKPSMNGDSTKMCAQNDDDQIQKNLTYLQDDKTLLVRNIDVEQYDLSDLCDLVYFGISKVKNIETKQNHLANSVVEKNSDFRTDSLTSSQNDFVKSPDIHRNKSNTTSTSHGPWISRRRIISKNGKNNKCAREFFELEAQVTINDNEVFSNDEDEDSLDNDFDSSFVDNSTQVNNTEMQAVYLKSIKSPKCQKIIRKPKLPFNFNEIYSQPVSTNEPNTYLEDSFCVDVEDSELTQKHELTELEILEQKLKKKKSYKSKKDSRTKNKRIFRISSDCE